jgi:hypothetical protein
MDASDGSGLEGLSTTEALRTSALQQRANRLTELPISLAIQKYWEILKVNKKNELSKDEFTNLVHRMHKALLLRFAEPEEGPFTVDDLWGRFVKGKSMKLDEFSDFMVELGDVWTMAGSPDEYVTTIISSFHPLSSPSHATNRIICWMRLHTHTLTHSYVVLFLLFLVLDLFS